MRGGSTARVAAAGAGYSLHAMSAIPSSSKRCAAPRRIGPSRLDRGASTPTVACCSRSATRAAGVSALGGEGAAGLAAGRERRCRPARTRRHRARPRVRVASRGTSAHAGGGGLLAKAGFDTDALECGIHWPYDEAAARALAAQGRRPSALHNNCSGKHAGFLCLACVLGGDGDVRRSHAATSSGEHPVMRAVTAALQATTGCDLAHAAGHRRLLDPDLRDPAAPPRPRLRATRHRQGLAPGHAQAARRLRDAVARHRSSSPAPTASTRA